MSDIFFFLNIFLIFDYFFVVYMYLLNDKKFLKLVNIITDFSCFIKLYLGIDISNT